MRRVVLAKRDPNLIKSNRKRLCPQCGEVAPYFIKSDFVNADLSDDRWTYKECALCWYKEQHVNRTSSKKKRLNSLMEELLNGTL